MEEIWKPVIGFEKYKISNLGNLRGIKTVNIKPFISNSGYAVVSLCKNGTICKKLLHRLVAEAFVDNPNNYIVVDHINRNKTDNSYTNLRWVTSSENSLNKELREREMFGLRWHKRGSGYYEIRFTVNCKERSFGTARTLDDAKRKRDEALNRINELPP